MPSMIKYWFPFCLMIFFLKLPLFTHILLETERRNQDASSTFCLKSPQVNSQVHGLQILLSAELWGTFELYLLPLYSKNHISSNFQ